jgi:hypothetical protein
MNTALHMLVALARADAGFAGRPPPERLLELGPPHKEDPSWLQALRNLLQRMLASPQDAERQHHLVDEARVTFQDRQGDWDEGFRTGLMNDPFRPVSEVANLMQGHRPFDNVGVYTIWPCSRCHTEVLRRDAHAPFLDVPVPTVQEITMEALVQSFFTTEAPREDFTCPACAKDKDDKTNSEARVAPFSHLPKTFLLHLQRNFNFQNEDEVVATRVTQWERLTVFPHPEAPVTYRAVARPASSFRWLKLRCRCNTNVLGRWENGATRTTACVLSSWFWEQAEQVTSTLGDSVV